MSKLPLKKISNFLYKKGTTTKAYIDGIYPMIVTADPDFIQHVFQRGEGKYIRAKNHFKNLQDFWGRGLLSSAGDYWLRQRRLIQPCFHKNREKEMLKLMNLETNGFLEELDVHLGNGGEIDIQEKMQVLSLRIIANAIFSANLRRGELLRISAVLSELRDFIRRSIHQPYLHWWVQLTEHTKIYEALKQESTSVFQPLTKVRRNSEDAFDDLLQMLLHSREGMSVDQLINEINILSMGGHDTSANTLSWTWYLLSQHPEVVEKLSKEIDQVICGHEVSHKQLGRLTYTQQVIEEVLRLYPSAWTINRIAIRDDEFDGIKIKKGTTVATYIYGLHRSPELWKDPDAFRPERFTEENKKTRHPYGYIPFGAAPMLCVGKQFALMEMKLILAKMVKRYKVELINNQKIEASPLINLHPQNDIKVWMYKRNDNYPIYPSHTGLTSHSHCLQTETVCPYSSL